MCGVFIENNCTHVNLHTCVAIYIYIYIYTYVYIQYTFVRVQFLSIQAPCHTQLRTKNMWGNNKSPHVRDQHLRQLWKHTTLIPVGFSPHETSWLDSPAMKKPELQRFISVLATFETVDPGFPDFSGFFTIILRWFPRAPRCDKCVDVPSSFWDKSPESSDEGPSKFTKNT